MKTRIIVLALAALGATAAWADTYVQGHLRSDGTYAQGHWRSAPNSTTLDNYSTAGNSNPYTAQPGYRQDLWQSPTGQRQAPTYTGPQGGRYYINANGKKTYVQD